MRFLITILFLINPGFVFADTNSEKQKEAIEAVLNATYKHFGIEENINNYFKSFIPIRYQKYAENIAPIIETATKQRLELKWDF